MKRGELYFVSDGLLPHQKIITAAGFQISSFKTAFFIYTDGLITDIQLLSGQLSVKYNDKKSLISAQLSSGEGATGTSAGRNPALNAYKLSTSQISNLTERINRIKKTGQWFERNPKEYCFPSGEIRIEYWKEE
jgi:hypothetical protein